MGGWMPNPNGTLKATYNHALDPVATNKVLGFCRDKGIPVTIVPSEAIKPSFGNGSGSINPRNADEFILALQELADQDPTFKALFADSAVWDSSLYRTLAKGILGNNEVFSKYFPNTHRFLKLPHEDFIVDPAFDDAFKAELSAFRSLPSTVSLIPFLTRDFVTFLAGTRCSSEPGESWPSLRNLLGIGRLIEGVWQPFHRQECKVGLDIGE